MVWHPTLMESSDGLPLATKISDLVYNFPYDRLPKESIALHFFLRPECMLALLLTYLASKPIFARLAKHIDTKASWFIASLAVHNFLLAVFSLVVAVNAYPILFDHYKRHGAYETYCDPNGSLWESGFGSWAVIFYLSKYWEFADTWILILKGKKPSLLQVYHHTGVALCMWIGVVSQSSWLTPFVLLNSVIHVLMYTYFMIKTVSPKTQIKSIKYLTNMQISQFIIGSSSYIGVLILGSKCDTESSRFGNGCTQVYLMGLIALFSAFKKRRYAPKKPKCI